MVVADSVWSLMAAVRAGCPAVGVRSGAYSPRELRAAGAEHVFESLHDLHRHIEGTALARPDASG